MLVGPKWNIPAAVFSKMVLQEMSKEGIYQGGKV